MKAHRATTSTRIPGTVFTTQNLFDPTLFYVQQTSIGANFSRILFTGTLADCEAFISAKLQSQQELFVRED